MLDPKIELGATLFLTVFIALGFYLTSQIDLAFSSELETISGPRTYPRVILSFMLFFNVLLIGQQLIRLKKQKAGEDKSEYPEIFTAASLRVLLGFAILLVFTFIYEPLGYLLAMPPLMVVVAKMYRGENYRNMIIVCTLMALVCLVIFRYGLDTVLPEGLLSIDMIINI